MSNSEPFAIGGTRMCYLHPDDQTRCIKVLRSDRTPLERRKSATGIRKFRSLRHWDDQFKEQVAYKQLITRHGASLWNHIPKFHEVVATDLGMGIVTTVFRNYDGHFPLNLDQQIPLGIDDPLRIAIDEFKQWLRSELVLTRNLLPHNIIAVRDTSDTCRLVVVDGLGNSEWIPIASWFKAVAKLKIERKISRFDERIELLKTGA
ncbi:MAG: YrbL family protein [Gammaproteobacteria bacterium]|nr:YrbL family protein [Gammaproteobacteria bacterium]